MLGTLKRIALAAAVAASSLTAGAAAAADRVDLKLWITGVGYDRLLKEIIPLFEKENPGVKVEGVNLAWDSYQQKILTGIAGNSGPDVFSFYSVDTAPWAAKGILAQLDGKIDRDAFIPNALANGEWDGKIYSLPIGMRARPLYYRKDFFAAAGLSEPPANWEQLRDYAKKLVKRDASGNLERVGFWVPTNHPYKTVQVWLDFLWNAGGEVFSADGKQATFNGPEGVKATEFLASLIRDDKVDVPGAIKIDNTDFGQGRVAMLMSNAVTRNLVKNFPDIRPNVGVALPPGDKRRVVEISGDMIGMAKGSKHPAEAEKLLKFIATRPEIAQKYAEIDENPPSLKALIDSDYAKKNTWIPGYLEMVQHGKPLPAHPKWTEISDVLTKAIDSVYIEGKPAKAALDDAAAKANEIIKRP